MLQFNKKYFLLTIILFIIEVLIAVFVHDKIIRPYVGDILVVILIYCFIKSFFNFSVWKTAIGVLIFSFTIEFLQYFKVVKLLGLQSNHLAKTVIGTSFAWEDLVAYLIGIITVLIVEKRIHFSLIIILCSLIFGFSLPYSLYI